jgi:hypothetical protein
MGVELFKIDRTEHSDAGVASGRVVPALYPFEDGIGKISSGIPGLSIENFELQGPPE